jgi:hypothetical protein
MDWSYRARSPPQSSNNIQVNERGINDVEKGAKMKKTYVAVIASALAIAAVTGGSRLRAHADTESEGIPLQKLAGSFAGQGEANYNLCFNADFSSLQDCATTPADHFFPWHLNFTSQGTADTKGNACSELIQTDASVLPLPFAATVSDFIIVEVSTSYNPSIGSGDSSFTEYVAGPGVKCNGSTFINTDGATAVGSGTLHLVASNNGNRLDAVTLTIKVSPINGVSGFVGHSFAVRQ